MDPVAEKKARMGGGYVFAGITITDNQSPITINADAGSGYPVGVPRFTTGAWLGRLDEEGYSIDPLYSARDEPSGVSPSITSVLIGGGEAYQVTGRLLYNDDPVIEGYLDGAFVADINGVRTFGGKTDLPEYTLGIIAVNVHIPRYKHVVRVNLFRRGVFLPTVERGGGNARYVARELLYKAIAAFDPEDPDCEMAAGTSIRCKYWYNTITGQVVTAK